MSTLISTQKWRAIAPAIRSHCTALFVFRLRSQQELEAFAEEVSALVDKKTVMRFYREATEELLRSPIASSTVAWRPRSPKTSFGFASSIVYQIVM